MDIDELFNNLSQPSIQMIVAPSSDKPHLVGRTKLGGCPDTPKEFVWPQRQGRQLDFVGQINTNEVNGVIEGSLPKDTLISIFYDSIGLPSGINNNDESGWNVSYFKLRDTMPAQPDVISAFQEQAVSLVRTLSVPCPDSFLYQAFVAPRADRNLYYDKWIALKEKQHKMGFGTSHRILGHPDAIQHDVYWDAQSGRHAGEPGIHEEQSPQEIAFALQKWRLLVQIDSLIYDVHREGIKGDPAYWGDMGKIFVCQEAPYGASDTWLVMQY